MFLANKFKATPMMRRCFSYDVTKTALQNTVPINRNAAEDYDLKKTYPIISLDAFYENLTSFTLTDAEAMQYMTFAAKMARIRFESDAEMLSLVELENGAIARDAATIFESPNTGSRKPTNLQFAIQC